MIFFSRWNFEHFLVDCNGEKCLVEETHSASLPVTKPLWRIMKTLSIEHKSKFTLNFMMISILCESFLLWCFSLKLKLFLFHVLSSCRRSFFHRKVKFRLIAFLRRFATTLRMGREVFVIWKSSGFLDTRFLSCIFLLHIWL